MAQKTKKIGEPDKQDAVEVPGLRIVLPKESGKETVEAAKRIGSAHLEERRRAEAAERKRALDSALKVESQFARARVTGRLAAIDEARRAKELAKKPPKSELEELEGKVLGFIGDRWMDITVGDEEYKIRKDYRHEGKVSVEKGPKHWDVGSIDEVAKVIRAAAKIIEKQKT